MFFVQIFVPEFFSSKFQRHAQRKHTRSRRYSRSCVACFSAVPRASSASFSPSLFVCLLVSLHSSSSLFLPSRLSISQSPCFYNIRFFVFFFSFCIFSLLSSISKIKMCLFVIIFLFHSFLDRVTRLPRSIHF